MKVRGALPKFHIRLRVVPNTLGTLFVSTTINSTEEVDEQIVTMFTPSISATVLKKSAETLLELYPDVPALGACPGVEIALSLPHLGAPFNTGNQTFGLSNQFKRASAICSCV